MSAVPWALWGLTFACVLGAIGCSILSGRNPRLNEYGRRVAVGAAAIAVLGLVHRTVVAGHLPLFGTFENTYTASAFLLGVSAAAARREWVGREAWRLLLPWAAVIMLWGLRYRTVPTPVTISEQSVWVDVHVMFAWLAHAILLWAGSLALKRIIERRRAEVPESEEHLLFLLLSAGYILLTVMICIGAWYLFVLFATFWRWEIVGTIALITWLGYGLVIHGRLLHGVRGQRLDLYAALMVVPLVLVFWVWSLYPYTYHFFDIVLVKP